MIGLVVNADRYVRESLGLFRRLVVAVEQTARALEVLQVMFVEEVERERAELDAHPDRIMTVVSNDPKCLRFAKCSADCPAEGPHTYNESSDGTYDQCPGGGI